MTHDFSGRFRVGLERLPSWLWGKSGNSGKTSNGTIHPNIFVKKVIPFEVLPFSRFHRIYRNFLYHLFGLLGPLLSAKTFRNLQYLICCREVWFVGGKTNNIAIQLILQPCCKTKCTFFVARFTKALIILLYYLYDNLHTNWKFNS